MDLRMGNGKILYKDHDDINTIKNLSRRGGGKTSACVHGGDTLACIRVPFGAVSVHIT
jgi:hypothetical protein